VEVGILSLNNDQTHLKGIWNVDKPSIDRAHSQHIPLSIPYQQEKTEGWSISFSPAAVLGAFVLPVGAFSSAIAAMPTVNVQRGKGHKISVETVPMEFSANELFIQCNGVIFSGPKYGRRGQMPSSLGRFTMESLANIFDSDDEQSQVGISLTTILETADDVPIDKSVLEHSAGAVPHVTIVTRAEITKQAQKRPQRCNRHRVTNLPAKFPDGETQISSSSHRHQWRSFKAGYVRSFLSATPDPCPAAYAFSRPHPAMHRFSPWPPLSNRNSTKSGA
jgi:hypothetical protein